MQTAMERKIVEQDWIDRAADPLQDAVRPLLDRAPQVADALHGKWLGHPLHAAMTDFPIGAWATAQVLDSFEAFGNSRKYRPAADLAVGVGLVTALGAAVAGIADWSKTKNEAKRLGFVHGLTNVLIAGLYGGSLFARSRKHRGVGIALSSVGFGLLVFSGWLGGEMSYRLGVGVRSDAFDGDRSPELRKLNDARDEEEPLVTLTGSPNLP